MEASIIGFTIGTMFAYLVISLLEGDPPKKEIIEQLQTITGYSKTAFRTLIKHSDLDPHHRDELDELLEMLPLTPKHEQWITFNALYSANKFMEIRNPSAVCLSDSEWSSYKDDKLYRIYKHPRV